MASFEGLESKEMSYSYYNDIYICCGSFGAHWMTQSNLNFLSDASRQFVFTVWWTLEWTGISITSLADHSKDFISLTTQTKVEEAESGQTYTAWQLIYSMYLIQNLAFCIRYILWRKAIVTYFTPSGHTWLFYLHRHFMMSRLTFQVLLLTQKQVIKLFCFFSTWTNAFMRQLLSLIVHM